ncbi:MAG: FtsX-like permease family protein [Cytophagaceae bacterium]|jgi:lipoprotein-releasing system permease protein|nr:FtsX-like permease family protein [Cytophagaceae bacterium]
MAFKLNLFYFISTKIHKNDRKSFSSIVQRIAVLIIFLSFFLIIVSLSVLQGFKTSIRNKIFSFSAHVIINKYDTQKSYEESPFFIDKKDSFYTYLTTSNDIKDVQEVAHKPALLRSSSEVQGIIFKGIKKDFSRTGFKDNIIQGDFLKLEDSSISNQIIISQRIAEKLHLKLTDTILLYFVQQPPRYRKVIINGIYETGLEELDEYFVMGDLRLLQQLNAWKPYEIGALEIYLTDFSKIDTMQNQIFERMEYDMQIQSAKDKYMQLFDWLSILNRNVVVFLVLLFMVSGFVISATLIVMILERTSMVGIFKALGMPSVQIRKIFMWNGFLIINKGMISGILAGVLFCFIQQQYSILPLDARNYYMNTVPIEFPWYSILIVCSLFFGLLLGITFLPTYFITKMKLVKSIKFN